MWAPRRSSLRWDSFSQETRIAGLISSGIDAPMARALADDARVSGADADGRVELSEAALAAAASSALEPELVGEGRRMFSLVRATGAAPLRPVVASAADGTPIADGGPDPASSPDVMGGEGSSSGFSLTAPG